MFRIPVKFIARIMLILVTITVTSCKITHDVQTAVNRSAKDYTINMALTRTPVPDKYVGLDYGIKLVVQDNSPASENLLKQYDARVFGRPILKPQPAVRTFVNESMREYMRTMGFNLDADVSTDYMLNVNIQEFNVNYISGMGWVGVVQMAISVSKRNGEKVYPNVTVTGRATESGATTDISAANKAMNGAYAKALEDIDWDRIAFFLNRASTPAAEGNKKVSGDGDTALENTIILWNIESSPRGADVYWRVISSTPEVKNTNRNFIGSTPYEATESFDIKGLTYNNSGNVQIEVSCEKNGYVTQKKRFNLRQAIDQKEISTKFNLIKED